MCVGSPHGLAPHMPWKSPCSWECLSYLILSYLMQALEKAEAMQLGACEDALPKEVPTLSCLTLS